MSTNLLRKQILKLNTTRIFEWGRTYYDRLLAGLVLVFLLGSLLYLVMLVGGAKSMRQRLEQELATLQPSHEHASMIDTGPYQAAVDMLARPDTLKYEDWTNSLTVPERRVWCVDCKMPIPFDARVCRFCNHVQPKPRGEREDWDKDGMKDEWERKHGLDPNDASDAMTDADGDGYSNLTEFKAGTDPNDPEDFPPPEKDLWLVRLDAEAFPLLFRSKVRLPDGLQFGINALDFSRTHFVEVGEKVNGFTVSDYEEKKKSVFKESLGREVQIDASELTLKRNEEQITLVIGKRREYTKYSAILNFQMENKEFRVREGDQFVLKGIEYKVLDIDTDERNVLINKLPVGEKIKIGRASGRDSQSEPES